MKIQPAGSLRPGFSCVDLLTHHSHPEQQRSASLYFVAMYRIRTEIVVKPIITIEVRPQTNLFVPRG